VGHRAVGVAAGHRGEGALEDVEVSHALRFSARPARLLVRDYKEDAVGPLPATDRGRSTERQFRSGRAGERELASRGPGAGRDAPARAGRGDDASTGGAMTRRIGRRQAAQGALDRERPRLRAAGIAVAASLLGIGAAADSVAFAADATTDARAQPVATGSAAPERGPYSPWVDRDQPDRVFWGDTHVHSSWSPDANAGGNTRIDPDAAYRFAKGETVVGHNGEPVRLRRPLDFLVLADHSEYMGLYPMLEARDPDLLANPTGRRWAALIAEGKRAQVGSEFAMGLPSGRDLIASPAFQRSVWQRVIENAERHDEPGRFTAFIGYEWSSMPKGANLHRIVVFADGAERTSQVVPFRSIDSDDPEALWRYLADYERATGGRALAIPHNGNLSAGRMFELVDMAGKPFSKAYATERARWEPLVEATQIKGDSETAPELSPDDEFADYGTWDEEAGMTPRPHEDRMYAGEYVRPALARGLAVARALGVNPFAFGLIGSTDAHTGLATSDDADFWGKFNSNEPHAGRAEEPWAKNFLPEKGTEAFRQFQAAGFADRERSDQSMTWKLVASGLAAVWAKENTRAALFDAMRRRETYATTGPRMVVRFFGGWSFEAADADAPDLAATGYGKGVPMGGVLASRPAGAAAPAFLVSALRDPDGANLDRIQIVKLWLDPSGEWRERIFDVALAGGRAVDGSGRCRIPVGDTVDLATATYSNTIGASLLSAVWRDPDFDAAGSAVYYVRVLEIPTPHWTTYDAARYGRPLPAEYPGTTRERAYTSPIWYDAPARR